MTRRVLIVDDDAAVREALSQTLELNDLVPVAAGSFIVAKDHLTAEFDGVVLSDIRMPGRDGFHLLEFAQRQDRDLPVILLTGEGDIPMAVAAMQAGAFGFLEKPCAAADMLPVLERALKTRALVLENRALKAQLQSGDPAARMIFGTSALAEVLRGQVRQAATAGRDVLVQGAAGSGVSKVAEVVHLSGPRARGPFVKRASLGLSRESLRGAMDEAKGGALFIDEIGQMPADCQMLLADALEAGEDLRLIGGTTADLDAEQQAGRFSADLFFRLGVMRVRIPALRERPEDIPEMFRRYVAQAGEQAGLTAPEITSEVIAGLMAQDWPGNARALMTEAMRFVLGFEQGARSGEEDLGLAEQMAQIERQLLIAALRKAGGQASAAAGALKLPRKTFYDKLARHGLRPEAYRG